MPALLRQLRLLRCVASPLAAKAVSPLELKTNLDACFKVAENKILADLLSTTFGELVKNKAEQVIQRSAKDLAGDERLQTIQRTLKDEKLPRWIPKESDQPHTWTLVNMATLRSGLVYDALLECVDTVYEALSTWSSIHRDEHVEDAMAELMRVVAMAQDMEATWCLEFHELARPGCVALRDVWASLWKEGEELVAFCQKPELAEVWPQFVAVADMCGHSLLEQATAVVQAAEKVLQSEHLKSSCGVAKCASALNEIQQSITLRSNMQSFCWILSQLSDPTVVHIDTFVQAAAMIRNLQETGNTFALLDPAPAPAKGAGNTFVWESGSGEAVLGPACADVVPEVLLDGAFCEEVSKVVEQSIVGTMQDFADAASVACAFPAELSAEQSLRDSLLCLLVVDESQESQVAEEVGKVLEAGRGSSGFPASLLLGRLQKVLQATEVSQVDARPFLARPSKQPVRRHPDFVFHLAKCIDIMHRLGCYLVFLAGRVSPQRWEAEMQDGELRSVVRECLDEIDSLTTELREVDTDEFSEEHRSETWMFRTEDIGRVADGVQKIARECRGYFFGLALRGLESFSADASRIIPSYAAFITDAHYHRGLARSQLLEWPHRGALPTRAKRLHELMRSVLSLRDTWGLASGEHGARCTAAQEKAAATLQELKKALAVDTAVEILEGCSKSADQRKEVASKLLAKSALLPAALVKALKEAAVGR